MPLPRIQRSVRSSLPDDAITEVSPVRNLRISHEGKQTRAAADHLLYQMNGARTRRIRSREQTVQLTLLAVAQRVDPMPFVAGEIEEPDNSVTRRLGAGAAGEPGRRTSAEQPQERAASVSTIYYDTPSLELLGAKVDSDYLKLKVRLRWYDTAQPGATAFLELKTRLGSLRHKIRIPTELPAAWLDDVSMEDPALVRVLHLAQPFGIPLPGPLMPALMLRYCRHRFVELASGARVTLDTAIEVPRAHKGLFHGGAAANLPVAVLEIKGDADDLPPPLRPLLHLGARRGSFSKYGMAAREVLGILA